MMFTFKNLIRLLLVGLLLAIPIVGVALDNHLATADAGHFAQTENDVPESGTAIACSCQEPGGSGGSCC